MDKILDSFFEQCEKGKVQVGEIYYNLQLSLKGTSEYVNINIKDKKLLYNYINEFLRLFQIQSIDEIYIKLIYLFSNLTFTDYDNILEYIRRNIMFVKNKILSAREYNYLETKIKISILESFQETPYCFKVTIVENNYEYELPLVYYGIDNGICYIYAVQDKNKDKSSSFSKKIKRILYKMNSGIKESVEYEQYKKGESNYYPENISDVSPSAILVLSLFFKELLDKNINNVKVVPFLPVRYNAKKKAYKNKIDYLTKKDNLNEIQKQELIKFYQDEHLRIQNNLTQKFIRNFFRLCYHFSNIEIASVPFEGEEYMNIELKPFEFDIFETLGIDKIIK